MQKKFKKVTKTEKKSNKKFKKKSQTCEKK